MHTGSASRPIAVRCPRCNKRAEFGAPYAHLQGAEAEAAVAAGKPGRRYNGGFALERYPRVFPWTHPRNPCKAGQRGRWGVVVCPNCTTVRAHELETQRDLWFQVEVAGRRLYFGARDEMTRLLRYLRADQRDDFWFGGYICCGGHRLPAHFQTKRNRHLAIRAIERFLGL
jgi:hypothetical protein